MDEQRARYISALIYTAVSLLGAVAFLAATTLRGDYNWVARLGGAGWVFLLLMIILMPTVTPWVKKRLGGRQG
jgi:DMSO/TMAO reductase YedYZ heme-binding membrane subunit